MYPIMLDMSKRLVLVVGGGSIAARKIRGLLQAKAMITVISPTLHNQIPREKICWQPRCYQSQDVSGYHIIFACTSDRELNERIANECQTWQLVNNTSDKAQSTFFNMATTLVEDTVYAVSTFGESPSRAKKVNKELKDWLVTKGKRDD